MELPQRTFTHADQMRFASASGDANPMHIDALAARRTQAGAPVVHGIHLLLWALDWLAVTSPELPRLRSLSVKFNKFIYVGEAAEIVVTKRTADEVRLTIAVSGASRSKVIVRLGRAEQHCPAWAQDGAQDGVQMLAAIQSPQELTMDAIEGRAGMFGLAMTSEAAEEMFPAASGWLGERRVAGLAATTYLVGMVCPGLYSIYSGLSLESCAACALEESLAFRVAGVDPRFHSVEQEVAGAGWVGTVESFARTPPVPQATMASLAGAVGGSEFAGSLALVIGGSRGLGELTAKVIAAGGGRVLVSWQAGRDDAERVAAEIRSAGGWCETLAYDARKAAAPQLAHLQESPTHAYYFATPSIFRPQAEMFQAERLQEFLRVYVEGFWELAQALRVRRAKVSLFYPSSIAVEDRPRDMTEYTMAKAAGEVLCADMNVSLAPLHVVASRLPRLPTDQTASVTATETVDPLATMLPLIRDVQAWPR